MYDTCYMRENAEDTRQKLVAENLRTLIEEKGTNPSAVSKAIDMAHTTVRHIILGTSRNPQHTTLQKIADHLGVDVRRITVGPDFERIEASRARILDRLSRLSAEKRLRLEGYLEALDQEPD